MLEHYFFDKRSLNAGREVIEPQRQLLGCGGILQS